MPNRPRPLVLCILDGWGERAERADNAILLAKTPNWQQFLARYQGTVIVIGTYHERGTLNGKGYYHHGRFTDTWVRQGSSWMCIASQSTLIQQ